MGIHISTMIDRFFPSTPSRIIMLGLDNAGKTTMLYKLKLGQVIATPPTIGFNVETVVHQNTTFTLLDGGGQTKVRPLWQHYLEDTDALIYFVDSQDRERFAEAREELDAILADDRMCNASILVFSNKTDLPGSATTTEVLEKLGLEARKERAWFLQASCAITGEGIGEGMEWLADNLKKRKTTISVFKASLTYLRQLQKKFRNSTAFKKDHRIF